MILSHFIGVQYKPAYTIEDWNDLFFSDLTYITPNKYCPEGKNVYGSMKDYFSIMSDHEFSLTGYVLNPDNNYDGIPDWITLPNTKEYYNLRSMNGFRLAAKNAAVA